TQGKRSDISNAVAITPVDVPGKVANLTATPDQRQVFLRWDKPADAPELADAYIVTRVDAPGDVETVTGTSYEDIRYNAGKMVTYQVTAARRSGTALVPGIGPVTVTVTLVDKMPPQVPSGLDITVDSGAFLTWDANSETDLAGYRVYRSERADGGFKLI